MNQIIGGKSDDQPRIGDCILANFINLSWSKTYSNQERLQTTILEKEDTSSPFGNTYTHILKNVLINLFKSFFIP